MSDQPKEPKDDEKRVYVVTHEDGGILQSTEACASYDAALEYVRVSMKDENPADWKVETDDEYPERAWSWYEYASDDGAHYVIHELGLWESPEEVRRAFAKESSLGSVGQPYRCDNCDFVGDKSETHDAKDLDERLESGGVFTDRECPKCGALAYPVQGDA